MEILGRLTRGEGEQRDIQVLEELSNVMRISSLCGLGQSAPVPVMDSAEVLSEGL